MDPYHRHPLNPSNIGSQSSISSALKVLSPFSTPQQMHRSNHLLKETFPASLLHCRFNSIFMQKFKHIFHFSRLLLEFDILAVVLIQLNSRISMHIQLIGLLHTLTHVYRNHINFQILINSFLCEFLYLLDHGDAMRAFWMVCDNEIGILACVWQLRELIHSLLTEHSHDAVLVIVDVRKIVVPLFLGEAAFFDWAFQHQRLLLLRIRQLNSRSSGNQCRHNYQVR